MEIVIASTNLHKIREIRSILKPQIQCDFLSLHDFPDYTPPKETGKTFEENAFSKATHAAAVLNRWVLADDSGLVVPALNNAPGIYSARYAGEHATDKENRAKLLNALNQLPEHERIGYYVCTLALVSPHEGIQKQVKGLCEGSFVMQESGSGGFGYDPIFIKYDYSKTFAQLDEETKNRISHRRKALDKLMPTLLDLMEKG